MMFVIGLAAVGLSVPFRISDSAYKRRYRKTHPGCAWIPPSLSGWFTALLWTTAFFVVLFTVDPQSWESFKGGIDGTF